jgi:hypothetical protein
MLRLPRILFCITALVCAGAFADTITLTSGEKVEGKVVRETDAEITVEVKLSAAVTDERVIPRKEIAKIDKEMPDEIEWQAIKNLKPGPNSMAATQYEAFMRPLQSFLNTYPKSPHAAEASQILAIFSGEKARVEGGEVRLGDRWLSKEEVDKERYQISALLAYQFMRGQRASGDLIGALNVFDQIEKTYPGAKSFPDAVELARETLGALKVMIERAQETFATEKASFEAGVAMANAIQKPQLLEARQRELAQGEAAVAAAEKAKIKWPTLIARSDKNLSAIAKKIPTETQRLARFDVAKLRQSVQLADQGQKQLAGGNPAAGETLGKALTLWPANELAKRLQPEAAALRVAAKATPVAVAATPKATPVKATPTPRPKVVVEDTPPEPEKPFLLTVGGIITIIILLALVVAGVVIFRKIKGRANEILE